MNEIVKYHNDLSNQIVIKTLNANELNFFMAICAKMRDKGENEIIFTFSQLKELVKWTSNDNVDFIRSLQNTNKKLIALNFRFEDEREIVQFVLFPTFRINKDDKTLTVKVNEEFSFLLNNLSSNFTRFELENFTSLQSKYSKYLYKELMKFKSTGYAIFKIKEFREKLDIPNSYRMTHINQKVLSPAGEELSKVFQKFEFKKIKKGRDITHIEFLFSLKKEKSKKDDIIEEVEIIDSKPIDEIKEFWISSFPRVNFTKKHSDILEKLLQKNSVSYVKNYLKEQWEYLNHSSLVKNKEAYFSSLILEEKAALKDYVLLEHKQEKEMRLFEEPKDNESPILSTKNLTEDDFIQTELFRKQEELEEKTNTAKQDIELEQTSLFITEITKEEYKKIYQEYLKNNNLEDNDISKKVFDISNKNKYKIIEKKIYTVDDIDPNLLLSKNGKKLFGGALQTRINKILDEMNK